MSFENKQLEFGPFRIDTANHLLLCGDKPIPLAPKAYDTLLFLLENPNRLVTREELMKAVWPDSFVEDGNVSVNVFQLRKALGEMDEGPTYIQTVPRKGYRFSAQVRIIDVGSPIAPAATRVVIESPESPLLEKPPAHYAPPMHGSSPNAEAVVRKAVLPEVIAFPDRRPWVAGPSPSEPFEAAAMARPQRGRSWGLRFDILAVVVIVLIGGWLLWRHSRMPQQLSQRRLTSFAPEMAVTAACISTGGKFIAYSNPAGLFIQVISTGDTHSLSLPKPGFEVSGISWFPDSASLLVGGSSPGDASPSLWIVPVIGTGAAVMLDPYRAGAVSPDGAEIAIVNAGGPAPELKLMRSDGSDARTVVTGKSGEDFGSAAWSENGQRVIFVRYRWDAQFRQNSGSIAFYDLKSGRVGTVLSGLGFGDSVVSLRDGRIVYTMMPGGNPISRGSNIMEVRTDLHTGKAAGAPSVLTKWPEPVTGLSVNASGTQLVLRDLVVEHDIYLADLKLDGSGINRIRRVSFGAGRDDYPRSWAPDGKYFFFDTNRNGNWQIFKLPVAGEAESPFVSGADDQFAPRISPDGRWLLYLERPKDWREPQPVNLMRVPISGGMPEQVLKAVNFSMWGLRFECPRVALMPCMLAVRQDGLVTFRPFDPANGFETTTDDISVRTVGADFDWSLAPDGSKLAWINRNSSTGIHIVALLKRANGLSVGSEYTIPVRGWPHLHAISWESDGNGWFAVSSTPGGWTMLRIDPEGKASALLSGTGGWAPGIYPSPDGRHLAFSEQSSGSNVWILRNF